MLFSFDQLAFESEKERNFYYKVFAGYWLNELIPGLQARLDDFVSLLQRPRFRGPAAPALLSLSAEGTRVSFDNHGYLISGPPTDRGEFADVLVHDRTTRVVYAIEAKLYADWEYPKDIVGNGSRLQRIEGLLPGATVIPILLVSEAKWRESERHSGVPGNHFDLLSGDRTSRARVICWEDLANRVTKPSVKAYLLARLNTSKYEMVLEIADGWFRRSGGHTLPSN